MARPLPIKSVRFTNCVQGGKSPNDVMRAFSSSGLGVVEVLGVNVKNKSKKESGPRMFCYLQVAAEFRGIYCLTWNILSGH